MFHEKDIDSNEVKVVDQTPTLARKPYSAPSVEVLTTYSTASGGTSFADAGISS